MKGRGHTASALDQAHGLRLCLLLHGRHPRRKEPRWRRCGRAGTAGMRRVGRHTILPRRIASGNIRGGAGRCKELPRFVPLTAQPGRRTCPPPAHSSRRGKNRGSGSPRKTPDRRSGAARRFPASPAGRRCAGDPRNPGRHPEAPAARNDIRAPEAPDVITRPSRKAPWSAGSSHTGQFRAPDKPGIAAILETRLDTVYRPPPLRPRVRRRRPVIGLDGNRASRNRLESAGRRTTLRLYRETPLAAFRSLSQDIASQAEPRRAERIRGIPVGIDDGCARDPRDRTMDRSGTSNPPIPDACAC